MDLPEESCVAVFPSYPLLNFAFVNGECIHDAETIRRVWYDGTVEIKIFDDPRLGELAYLMWQLDLPTTCVEWKCPRDCRRCE
ncbi:MAG: hypothetical protein ACOYY2_13815 [Actinomycetota bacterium]